jgi:hypothetical protein
MAPKVLPITQGPQKSRQQQLQELYARRAVIDNLIEDLIDYSRFRAVRLPSATEGKRNTAA